MNRQDPFLTAFMIRPLIAEGSAGAQTDMAGAVARGTPLREQLAGKIELEHAWRALEVGRKGITQAGRTADAAFGPVFVNAGEVIS